MKLLVFGCGSIGTKHASNAVKLTNTAVFDTNQERAQTTAEITGARWFNRFDDALAWKPDGAVIAVPHDQHLEVASRVVNTGCSVLIEKPISHCMQGIDELLILAERRGCHVKVVCNMRFHPGPRSLREALQKVGRPLFARAQVGNYLPLMRPGVDYRDLYCARSSSGGGVILDAIHEIDYLVWLLGPVNRVTCDADRLSDLDIDVEDYAAIVLRHPAGVRSEIHLDYLQQFKRRGCEIVGTEGTLIWRSEGKQPEVCSVHCFEERTGCWETLYQTDALDVERPYQELMRQFVELLDGASSTELLDGRTAARELEVALSARVASAEGHSRELAG